MNDLLALARKEAAALGVPARALYRHLCRTGGDLEQAIERYLKYKADSGAMPLTWQGRSFPCRRAFIEWLAAELGGSFSQMQSRLYACGWDVAAVIAYFREQPAEEEAAAPEPEAALENAEGGLELLETHETPTESPPTEAPHETPTESPPTGGRHGSMPVLFRGHWFPSKSALARHLAQQEGLPRGVVGGWLFAPTDEDLEPRIDYFVQREARLRDAGIVVEPGLLIHKGRVHPTRAALVRWISRQIEGIEEEARAILLGLAGDVTAEVDRYCRHFGLEPPGPDPDAPSVPVAPAVAPPVAAQPMTGNGHAGNGHAAPAPAAAVEASDLASTIAGHIAGLAAAFAAVAVQHDRPATTTAASDIAPLVRVLADQENQLARLTARIGHLERLEDDKRQGRAAQTDMLTVIMHKVGQLAHDFEQMRNRSPAPRFTRARPLGVEPKE